MSTTKNSKSNKIIPGTNSQKVTNPTITAQTSSKQKRQLAIVNEEDGNGKNEASQISSISKLSSSLFEGSVALSASNAEFKESAVKNRNRKVNTWTPVLVWPIGFSKVYTRKKQNINNQVAFTKIDDKPYK